VILLFAIVIRDRFDGIVKFCGSLVTSWCKNHSTACLFRDFPSYLCDFGAFAHSTVKFIIRCEFCRLFSDLARDLNRFQCDDEALRCCGILFSLNVLACVAR
jgi:hypothetical protein